MNRNKLENISFIICFVIMLLFVGGATKVAGCTIATGASMKSNEFEKENSVNFILNYDLLNREVKRFDTVLIDDIKSDSFYNKGLFKRVIGLPGEHVYCDNGEVWINGEKLNDPYGYVSARDPYVAFEHTLGENEYFVLGDNRCFSEDSRAFGPVKYKEIRAKVVLELRF